MAKKLVQFEQLQKLTQGLYGKLHQDYVQCYYIKKFWF